MVGGTSARLLIAGLAWWAVFGAAPPPEQQPTRRVIVYLHGKIVEDQGPEAISERYGRYEYDAILEALRNEGNEVISEVRQARTDPSEYARKIASEISRLTSSGVSPRDITVVGASKGAAIAVLVSHLLQDPDLNYVLLAICGPQMLEYWEAQGICVTGNLLSVYESSDELAQSCGELASRCSSRIGHFEEIELHLGTGHGIVYRPLDDWVKPALRWSVAETERK
jgi:hypothetical protein